MKLEYLINAEIRSELLVLNYVRLKSHFRQSRNSNAFSLHLGGFNQLEIGDFKLKPILRIFDSIHASATIGFRGFLGTCFFVDGRQSQRSGGVQVHHFDWNFLKIV